MNISSPHIVYTKWGLENLTNVIYIYIIHICIMYISWANLTPIFDKYEQITYRQAAIDSSMPGKFKKCN